MAESNGGDVPSTPSVLVGQIWQDNDPRSRHRVGEIVEVNTTHAVVRWTTGKQTRVRLSRFRPNATGYLFVSDPKESV